MWCWLLSRHLGKSRKEKKCDTERYRTEAQRPQWLAMPFHLVLCWSSCHWIFERSKKSLKVTWKVVHEKQQEAKSYLPVQVTLSLNSWPLTSSEGAQWGTGISGGDGLLLFVGGWICCCPHSYVKYNDPLSFSLIHDSLKNRPGELRLSTFSYAMVIWAIITVVHYCVQVFCETKSVQWAVFFLIPL